MRIAAREERTFGSRSVPPARSGPGGRCRDAHPLSLPRPPPGRRPRHPRKRQLGVARDLVAVERGNHMSVERDAGRARRASSVAARWPSARGRGSSRACRSGARSRWAPRGAGALVVVGLVQVHHGEELGSASASSRSRSRSSSVSSGRGCARTGTPGASGPRRSAPRPRAGARSVRRRERVPESVDDWKRHIHILAGRGADDSPDERGWRSGTSVEDTYATSDSPATAASPAASPCSGPRPSAASSTTRTPGGRAGSSWSGARRPPDRPRPLGRPCP